MTKRLDELKGKSKFEAVTEYNKGTTANVRSNLQQKKVNVNKIAYV